MRREVGYTRHMEPDWLTNISHALIARVCRDGSGPFFLPGEEAGAHIRACFYYAVIMTPTNTVLLDNHGRGGMCQFEAGEVRACWETAALLRHAGISWNQLSSPSLRPILPAELPEPSQVYIDDAESLDGKFTYEEFCGLWGGEKPCTRFSELREKDPALAALIEFTPGVCVEVKPAARRPQRL